jgi:hypothetical protein
MRLDFLSATVKKAKEFLPEADNDLSTLKILEDMDATITRTRTITQSNTDAVGVTTFRRSVEVESESALRADNSPSADNLPDYLGQNINTTA